ncbi:hypothetical protein BJ912DRAFT_1038696 [Pholiota molesta]|nr:hypothetical protein BJ912DRAFT_1038696 [Pholiota molesta]
MATAPDAAVWDMLYIGLSNLNADASSDVRYADRLGCGRQATSYHWARSIDAAPSFLLAPTEWPQTAPLPQPRPPPPGDETALCLPPARPRAAALAARRVRARAAHTAAAAPPPRRHRRPPRRAPAPLSIAAVALRPRRLAAGPAPPAAPAPPEAPPKSGGVCGAAGAPAAARPRAPVRRRAAVVRGRLAAGEGASATPLALDAHTDIRRGEGRAEYAPSGWRGTGDVPALPGPRLGHGLNNVLQEACVPLSLLIHPTHPPPVGAYTHQPRTHSILTTHLTLTASARTPVFEPYTWSRLPLPYTLYDFALRPTRVPLSAFVGGVLAGAAGVDDGDPASTKDTDTDAGNATRTRRAVSAAYFEHVCAPSEVVEVVYGLAAPDVDDHERVLTPPRLRTHEAAVAANASVPTLNPDAGKRAPYTYTYPHPAPGPPADGRAILAWFARRLQAPDVRGARCVVVREDPARARGARRVFDAEFFGVQERIGPVLGEVLASPVMRGFAWAPLVDRAVKRSVRGAFGALLPDDTDMNSNSATNTNINSENSPRLARNTTHLEAGKDENRKDEQEQKANSADNSMLPGVLALHLRRGDYGRHCVRLARWGAPYLGVNAVLADKFDPVRTRGGAEAGEEDAGGNGERGEEEREKESERYYLEHCLPSIEQVVRRLRAVRAEYEDEDEVNKTSTLTSNSPSLHLDSVSHNNTLSTTTAHARQEWRLRHVYVLTNGWPAFVDALRGALLADGWASVVATPDLAAAHPRLASPVPNPNSNYNARPNPDPDANAQPNWGAGVLADLWRWAEWGLPVGWGRGAGAGQVREGDGAFAGLSREEQGVGVAVDMALAVRAEVFVGNGSVGKHGAAADGARGGGRGESAAVTRARGGRVLGDGDDARLTSDFLYFIRVGKFGFWTWF